MAGSLKNHLSIVSYNCNSIRNKVDVIRDILDETDILVCQEIILMDEDVGFINGLSDEFDNFTIPSKKSDTLDGRPSGGICIMWRNTLDIDVEIVNEHERYLIANISFKNDNFLIVNVYMPYDDKSNDIIFSYEQILGEIQACIDNVDNNNIILLGDFNADPQRGRLWSHLYEFVHSNSLTVADMCLEHDTFTYLSSAHNTTSWLDHFICSDSIVLNDIEVLYEKAIFDHFPIRAIIKISEQICNNVLEHNNIIKNFVDWSKFNDNIKQEYNNKVSNVLENYICDYGICTDRYCVTDHRNAIDNTFDCLLHAMRYGTIDYEYTKLNKFKPVPGWNRHCKQLYHDARSDFINWKSKGKIRHGILYEKMKLSRRLFVNALNYCKVNRQNISNQLLADHLKNKNINSFWREVRKRNNKCDTVTEIDGIKGCNSIADLFYNKFSAISGNEDNGYKLNYRYSGNNVLVNKFSMNVVKSAIGNLNTGIGFDCIHSNHLKFLSSCNIMFLTMFFNSCLIHNYVPKKMLEGVIRPIPKDRLGNMRSSVNYREVMVSSNIFKVFEYCLLPQLKKYIKLSCHQFGYRQQTSTLMATALLKETVNRYLNENSNVFACFLDLSKAFERVCHKILINKLYDNNVPDFLVNILKTILINGTARVNFNDCFTDKWKLSRGVRQGGVLSAFLFIFYIDEILFKVFNIQTGCNIGITRVNILAYADDIVLISPSRSGLQLLLNEIFNLLNNLRLILNVNKTVAMIFSKKKVLNAPLFLIGNDPITFVNEFKYLGVILTHNICDTNDMKRSASSFNKSTGYVIRKFKNVNLDILLSLFDSFCLHMYGCELWYNRRGSLTTFKHNSIFYHAALKKILNVPKYFSNHIVCSVLNMMTFEHFINFRKTKFLFQILKSNSPCFNVHKFYFLNYSYHVNYINDIWTNVYDVNNVFANDIDALLARIYFIQKHEPSSMFVGFN